MPMSVAVDELQEKRRGLVEDRRALKTKLTALSRDMAAVDRVLLMLDPTSKPQAPRANRRSPAGADTPFKHGEMTAAALEALRTLARPASSSECATAMLERKGLESDTTLHAQVVSCVSTVFAQKAAAGQIRRVSNGDARQVRWEVAR
jgi:hypothetical protein